MSLTYVRIARLPTYVRIMMGLSIAGCLLFTLLCFGMVLFALASPDVALFPSLVMLAILVMLSFLKVAGLFVMPSKFKMGYFLYTVPEIAINILLFVQYLRAKTFLAAQSPKLFASDAIHSEADALNEFILFLYVVFLLLHLIGAALFVGVYTYQFLKTSRSAVG
jgi:hypothetical protein